MRWHRLAAVLAAEVVPHLDVRGITETKKSELHEDKKHHEDRYYMGLARLASLRSKNTVTQVGACIVNQHGHPIGLGWNGLPVVGGHHDHHRKRRQTEPKFDKKLFDCHAEMNAMYFCNRKYDMPGSTIFTTLYPCNRCAGLILQTDITRAVYLNEAQIVNGKWAPYFEASKISLHKLAEPYQDDSSPVELQLTEKVIIETNCLEESPHKEDKKEREIYMNKKDFYMYIAKWAAMQSESPKAQVGAVVVGPDKNILGIGWNSLPKLVENTPDKWKKDSKGRFTWMVSAEINAILDSSLSNMEGCILYTTHFPERESAKHIIQSNIKKVYYLPERDSGVEKKNLRKIIRKTLRESGVIVEKYVAKHEEKIVLFGPDGDKIFRQKSASFWRW